MPKLPKAPFFAVGLIAAALLGSLPAAQAQQVDFAGKRITMIIPYQEGSGSTLHGRLLATAMEKLLPGSPTIVVKNIDGGGSVKGINQFAKDARPDGLTFAAIGTGTSLAYVLGDAAVAYSLPEMKAFLSSPFGVVAYARKDLGLGGNPIENVKKLLKANAVYGGATPTSSDLPALLSFDLLGVKPKYVFGLSSSESRAGFERGEISLKYDNAANWAEEVKPLVDEGIAVPLFTFGVEANGKIGRDPLLPDLPTFLEVYEAVHGKPLEGTAYNVWKALFNVRVMGGKLFVLPADTPPEIVAAYTKAVEGALGSDSVKSPQGQAILSGYQQSTGEAADKVFHAGLGMGEAELAWLKKWLSDVHNVTAK